MRSDREFMNRVRCIDQLDRATANALLAAGLAVRNLPLSMHLRRNQWPTKARRDSRAMFGPCTRARA